MSEIETALCHEWITTYGGSEVVASTIAQALGVRNVYSYAVDSELALSLFPGAKVASVSRVGHTQLIRRRWSWFLAAMPGAWRRLDLSPFELIVTSSHACVNAIQPPPRVPVISYCHTPMRYAWEWRSELGRLPRPARPLWPAVARRLQRSDRGWAQHVTTFVANSRNVADRISRYYGRTATIIYPPIDTEFWTPGHEAPGDYFLLAGRLVSYKRPDLVVQAATEGGVKLVVAGSGPELSRLRRSGGPTVSFVPNPSRESLRSLYRRAKALVFAGIEDFGMTLVEAQACGTPVIAYGEGGAMESVRDGETGRLFSQQDAGELARLMQTFSGSPQMSQAARENARRFDRSIFVSRFRDLARETAAAGQKVTGVPLSRQPHGRVRR